MKNILLKGLGMVLFVLNTYTLVAQTAIKTSIIDPKGKPIANATLRYGDYDVISDTEGYCVLKSPRLPVLLSCTHMNFKKLEVWVKSTADLTIVMQPNETHIEEVVVNTGYYALPKERVTGSFTVLDKEKLTFHADNNILNRMEGMANGVYFDKRSVTGEDFGNDPTIRIRGLSTIEGNTAPLVILDNFPFYGDLQSINPNDVESITILRDAAAASIWGAQAGNGVIVITSKKANYKDNLQVVFNSGVTWRDKPDLFYSQQYLPSATVMGIEEELFAKKAYTENDRTKIPQYVELLIKKRDKLISDTEFDKQKEVLLKNDLRQDYLDYVYRKAFTQRYGFAMRKGGETVRMGMSANLDKNNLSIIGNVDQRLTLNMDFGVQLLKGLEWQSVVNFSDQKLQQNGEGYNSTNGRLIYESLLDENGNPGHLSSRAGRFAYLEKAPSLGLLDWMYRPLDEVNLMDRNAKRREWRISQQLKYDLPYNLSFQVNYQFLTAEARRETLYDKDSYYVRNLVNTFTQANGARIIPYAGIMETDGLQSQDHHAGRMQLNWNQSMFKDHWVTALVGAEIGQDRILMEPSRTLYNFDPESWTYALALNYNTTYTTRPSGSRFIPSGNGVKDRVSNRQLSYFTNWGYGIANKYNLSASMRWDGSNLLGVKINEKGTVLWSAGASWDMAKESFMKQDWLWAFKWRITYGSAGNIDKSQSHYPTIRLSNNSETNQLAAALTHPGNPSLGWERVNTLNMALDWSLWNGALSGTVDYYIKKASNLLGYLNIDPSSGVTANYKVNYADLTTKGFDLQLDSRIKLSRSLTWNTTTLVNLASNRVNNFKGNSQSVSRYLADPTVVENGRSIDQIYALPWYGLDANNGMPLMQIDGVLTSDKSLYTNYYLKYKKEDLVDAGQTVPRVFGSVWNGFSFKGFTVAGLISYRLGHVFRKKSIGPGQEYLISAPVYHMDYFKRWATSGDEQTTNVPAWDATAAPNQRFAIYSQSMALILPADVIKFDNVKVSYDFKYRSIRSLKLYIQCNEVGILWRANNEGIDPDYINALYPPARNFTTGVQINF